MPYDNTNRGIIGKNPRKEKDTDADLSGHINVDGKEFWLNGWRKTSSKDGSTFYSLSVKPKEARQASGGGYSSDKSRRQIAQPDFPDDESIPF